LPRLGGAVAQPLGKQRTGGLAGPARHKAKLLKAWEIVYHAPAPAKIKKRV
jgi:hypothetical protein